MDGPELCADTPSLRFVGPQATIRVRDGKKLVHEGIKVEFVSTPST